MPKKVITIVVSYTFPPSYSKISTPSPFTLQTSPLLNLIAIAPIRPVTQALRRARPPNERIIRLATRPSSRAPLPDRIRAVDEVSVHGPGHVVGPADAARGAPLVEADGPRAGGNGGVAQQDGGVQGHDLTGGHEGLVVAVAGDAVGAAAAVEGVGGCFVRDNSVCGVDGILVAEPVKSGSSLLAQILG